MEIILLEKIRNLGDLGEVVNVKNGYARNYLIPQKKAMFANEDAKAKVEERRRELAAQESKRIEVAKARAQVLAKTVSIARLASEEGHLYGSVTTTDIAEALSQGDVNVEKSEVYLPEGPIKNIGEFTANVILHAEVSFDVTVTVTAEAPEGSVSSEEE